MKKLEEYVRSIPDFPEPGIIFRDITNDFTGSGRTASGNPVHAGQAERYRV